MQESRRETIERISKPNALFISVAAATTFLDQFSKWAVAKYVLPGSSIQIAGNFLAIHVVRNPGGAFGIFPTATYFFFLASVAIITVVLVWWLRRRESPLPLGFILGGGVGNLLDRLFQPPGVFRGHVVDFIEFPFWPTFNLADAAIVIGVGLLLLGGLRRNAK